MFSLHSRSSNRFASLLAIVLIVVFAVMFVVSVTSTVALASTLAQTLTTAVDPQSILLMTVGALFNWLLASGIGWGVQYVLAWFPDLQPIVKNVVGVFLLAGVVAAVSYIETLLTPAQLELTLLQVIFIVGTAFISWASQLIGRNVGEAHLLVHKGREVTMRTLFPAAYTT